MVALSKFFKDTIQHKQCSDIAHTGPCLKNAILNLPRFLRSNALYFAPTALVPLVFKLRRFDKEVLFNSLRYYGECIIGGTATGWTIQCFICIFRHLFGEFRYPYFVFVPSVIGSWYGLFCASQRIKDLFYTSIYQCVCESFIIQRKNLVTRTLADSRTAQIFFFMCCSALILHAKREQTFRGFWFLMPAGKTPKNSPHNVVSTEVVSPTAAAQKRPCTHAEVNCSLYILRGLRNYLAIGLTLDVIKMLMSRLTAAEQQLGFLPKLLAKCKNFEGQSSAFLGTYVGIYRLVLCLASRQLSNSAASNLVAAFVAGAAYAFLPKIALLTYSSVLAARVAWQLVKHAAHRMDEFTGKRSLDELKRPWWHNVSECLECIHFDWLLFPLSLAYTVHVYTLRRHFMGNLGDLITNGVTNRYARNINRIIEAYERASLLE